MTSLHPPDQRHRVPATFDPAILDRTNRRLLAELQADGRLRTAELGRRVGLSAPAVAERVQRLERAGVITGYHARIDPRTLGYAIAAVVRVRPVPRQLPKIVEVAERTPEVVECVRVTGDDCYLLRLHLRTMDDLEAVLDRFTAFGQTTTSIVHSAPIHRALPLDVDGAP